MSRKVLLLSILWGVFVAWSFLGWIATSAIQRPAYQVVQRGDTYEIRQYAPYLMAQVQLLGPYAQARHEGFGMLADYISRDNALQAAIARSKTITTGSPVVAEANNGMWNVSFILPAKYTEATIPRPTNPRVAHPAA